MVRCPHESWIWVADGKDLGSPGLRIYRAEHYLSMGRSSGLNVGKMIGTGRGIVCACGDIMTFAFGAGREIMDSR